MRIITGEYRGRTIRTVNDLSVRPATDRVRQTIFNMLANRMEFDGGSVLDLFAGSGILGFEALSRGAEHVTFVEYEDEAAEWIERNARSLGCLQRTEIVVADAMRFLTANRRTHRLVFADPPYSYGTTGEIPARIMEGGTLEANGHLIIEHHSGLHFADGNGYAAGPEKKFGRTLVTFFRHAASTTPAEKP